MSAPNRSQEIKNMFDNNVLTPIPKTDEEGRRKNLFIIIRHLNKVDEGNWGALRKDDRGGFIPSDIIVWKPTMEHFDVLTGDGGAFWKSWGPVTNPNWHFQEVDPEPVPEPTPEPEPVPDPVPAVCNCRPQLDALDAVVEGLVSKVEKLTVALQAHKHRVTVKVKTSRDAWHSHEVDKEFVSEKAEWQ